MVAIRQREHNYNVTKLIMSLPELTRPELS